MKSYTYFKNKIAGYEDVSETVKVIEKIAASSVHIIKKEVSTLNNFLAITKTVIERLSVCTEKTITHPLMSVRKDSSAVDVLLVISGGKGLVGGLWQRLAESYREMALPNQKVVLVGDKSIEYINVESENILRVFNFSNEIPSQAEVDSLYRYLEENFIKGNFRSVSVLYFKSASIGEQQPLCVPFLPFVPSVNYNDKEVTVSDTTLGWPIIESSVPDLLDNLFKSFIQARLYSFLLEARLSELSARTVSMEHAAQKTKEVVEQLQLQHARQRRHVSTQKHLESFTSQNMI